MDLMFLYFLGFYKIRYNLKNRKTSVELININCTEDFVCTQNGGNFELAYLTS